MEWNLIIDFTVLRFALKNPRKIGPKTAFHRFSQCFEGSIVSSFAARAGIHISALGRLKGKGEIQISELRPK